MEPKLDEDMVILYSAENFKDFLDALDKQLEQKAFLFSTIRQDKLKGMEEKAIFLTGLSDKENIHKMGELENLNLLLPVREENLEKDLKNHVDHLNNKTTPYESFILNQGQKLTPSFSQQMNQSNQRWKIIEDFGKYAKTKDCFEDFSEICMTIASELLTNAFYNAPQNKFGRALVEDRTKNVLLEDSKTVHFEYGDDGQFVWLKVKDPYGTFNRKALVANLMRSIGQDQLQVRFGEGGAGIGLFMVFNWASQLLFEFDPEKQTSVLVKLLKTKRRKIFDSERTILEVIQK